MVQLEEKKAFQIARESLRGGITAVLLTTVNRAGSLHREFV